METVSEENLRPANDVLNEYDEDEEFSFMSFGDLSLVSADEAFAGGQIKPTFPLFRRDLLSDQPIRRNFGEEDLPKKPHVKKIFVQAGGDHDDAPSSEVVEVTPPSSSSSEACKKSNSTGFSKVWRFKDLVSRSNSDGRDAFVFLNEAHAPPSKKPVEKQDSKVKVNGVRRTTPFSAHEVYLRNKAKAGKKRSSYLPYRPELMGFFTSVNGGFSKNVHPY